MTTKLPAELEPGDVIEYRKSKRRGIAPFRGVVTGVLVRPRVDVVAYLASVSRDVYGPTNYESMAYLRPDVPVTVLVDTAADS